MKNLKKIMIFMAVLFSAANLFAEIYMKEAIVSFYADDFNGKETSSGETFNMNDLTCASKTFPFDTELKITNNANGKSVVVRVNDRGPFVPDRELDLSKAAAVQLGMVNSGTAKVQIEIVKLGPDSKLSQDTAAGANRIMTERFGADWNKAAFDLSEVPDANKYEIQIASYSKKDNAKQTAKVLYSLGFRDIYIRTSGDVYRVVLKEIKKAKLDETEAKLKENNYKDYIIRVQK